VPKDKNDKPDYEDLSLNFDFKNREEFIQKLDTLKGLSTRKEFLDLFKFSSDD